MTNNSGAYMDYVKFEGYCVSVATFKVESISEPETNKNSLSYYLILIHVRINLDRRATIITFTRYRF